MSTARNLALLGAILVLAGCWEQVSPEWFAQMKQQPAVQAFEGAHAPTMQELQELAVQNPFLPPDGTIPIGGLEPRIDSPVPAFMPESVGLQNPIDATPASIERGAYVYGIYCTVCHGEDGMSNQAELPVARRLSESGMPPMPLVAVPAYTDGFLFTKIRYGKPGMPGYPHIAPKDRWHVVNYLRTLVKGGAAP